MVRNKKPTGLAMGQVAGIGIGVAIAMVLTIVGSAMIAWLLDTGVIQEAGIGYSVMGILLAASFVGSWVAVALVKHRVLAVGLMTGCAYFGMLLGLTAFFFGGQYQGILPTALLIGGGSLGAVLIVNGPMNGKGIRRHSIKHTG